MEARKREMRYDLDDSNCTSHSQELAESHKWLFIADVEELILV